MLYLSSFIYIKFLAWCIPFTGISSKVNPSSYELSTFILISFELIPTLSNTSVTFLVIPKSNNILSVIVRSTLKEGTNPQRDIVQTYNYDLINYNPYKKELNTEPFYYCRIWLDSYYLGDNEIYTKMSAKGWYPMEQVEQQKINQAKQKYSAQLN